MQTMQTGTLSRYKPKIVPKKNFIKSAACGNTNLRHRFIPYGIYEYRDVEGFDEMMVYDLQHNKMTSLFKRNCGRAYCIHNNKLYAYRQPKHIDIYDFRTITVERCIIDSSDASQWDWYQSTFTAFEDNDGNIFIISEIFIDTHKFKLTWHGKNKIWHYQTKKFKSFPAELLKYTWKIYVDTIAKRVYAYNDNSLIMFTDSTFENYIVLLNTLKPNVHCDVFKLDNYLYYSAIYVFDVNTHKQIPNGDYNGDIAVPLYLRLDFKPYITDTYVIYIYAKYVEIYNHSFNLLGKVQILDDTNNRYDGLHIADIYMNGEKLYCMISDISVRTVMIYCTRAAVEKMLAALRDETELPDELITMVMSYVGYKF